jgi:hypothetical protein
MKKIILIIFLGAICSFYNIIIAQLLFTVTPEVLTLNSTSGTAYVTVITSLDWFVEDNATWLTATKTNESLITVTYDANTPSGPRLALIRVFVPGLIEKFVTVQQEPAPTFDVSPNSRIVNYRSGTTNFAVSSTVEWIVEDDAPWLTATRTSGTAISVTYNANTSTSSRTANIKAGNDIVQEIVTVTQEAAPALDVTPNGRSVTSRSGTTIFTVISNVGWLVEDDAAWLTATKTDGSTISVTYFNNFSASSRTANIKAYGTGVEETVTVTQDGATFEVSPDSRSVGSTSGSTSFDVNSSVEWVSEDDATWLTVTKTDGKTISVTYDANTLTSSRIANIRAYGAEVEETVTVTQAGAAAAVDVSPNSRSVSSASGNTSFSVSSNVEWTVEDNASWLTATKTDGSTISVTYDANTSTSSRTANIRAYGTGVEETVTVTQAGAAATIDVSPNSRSVSSASGNTSFSVGSNAEWSVEDDASWLTASKTNGSTINITYDANTSASSRTANIRASGEEGVEETVTVIQAGAAATIDISPNSRSVSSASGSTSFSVSSNMEWSVEDNATWLTVTKTDGVTISVTYDANTSTSSRTANIRAYGTGGVEETVTVEQNGAIPNTITDLFDYIQIIIYPNPSTNKIYLRPSNDINSEILISLFDNTGKLLYSDNIVGLLSNESYLIDLSAYPCGIYMLLVNNSKSVRITKVIKQ